MGLGKKPFENIVRKAISPFLTVFYTLSKTEIISFVTFNMSSANAFNLVWSKILSCGNGLINMSSASIHVFPDFFFMTAFSFQVTYLVPHITIFKEMFFRKRMKHVAMNNDNNNIDNNNNKK